MLKIKTYVATSSVHGLGLFARQAIKKGEILWAFVPRKDTRIALEKSTLDLCHYGYVNPRRPTELVCCGDDSKWWNFPLAGRAPNSIEGEVDVHGEALIIAARDIAEHEELLIDPASDYDTQRKLAA